MDAKPKIKMVCEVCGSDDVSRDGSARWNVETQRWELSGLYDDTSCEDCRDDCKLEEETVED